MISTRSRGKRTLSFGRIAFLFAIPIIMSFTSCVYMKMNPPADVDKSPFPPAAGDNTCWQATASNMLAGAGYGNGASLQARADNIYGQIKTHFGPISGWTDAAVSWWLGSAHNVWPANPYNLVTVYGNKFALPWADAGGAQFIANELRRCQFTGLSISWPTNGATGAGGHAITCWGDNVDQSTPLTGNPTGLRVTDSDNEDGGNVQAYLYDLYTNPNPGGADNGNGWYFNYDANHPFIKHIITLCPTLGTTGNIQRVVGSYRIHQNRKQEATDLHYRVYTDVTLLSYKTEIDWTTSPPPAIVEANPRKSISVDWDLRKKPVPYCKWVTITTEFIERNYNALDYEDVHFTYADGAAGFKIPPVKWEMTSPVVPGADSIRNVTGGYVIGGFDIVDPNLPAGERKVGEYRFMHQYSFNQNPEVHVLSLSSEQGYAATNIRLGHSYGSMDVKQLWGEQKWMTSKSDTMVMLSREPAKIPVDWKGRLPYPQGEDIRGRQPKRMLRTP